MSESENPSRILYVSEISQSFQGEGKNLGRPCMFLRLAGCTLRCTWCDTQHARGVSFGKVWYMSVEDVIFRLEWNHMIEPALVATGGEPLLQRAGLGELFHLLRAKDWYIEVETAGVIMPTNIGLVDLYTVSPKLANSGNPLEHRIVPGVLGAFADIARAGGAVFKFVVTKMEDFVEIDELVARFGLWPVYIIQEGASPGKVLVGQRKIAGAALQRGYRLTTRLQVLLYGDEQVCNDA